MEMFCIALVFFMTLLSGRTAENQPQNSEKNTDYEAALQFLEENNKQFLEQANKESLVNWKYESNINDENMKAMLEAQDEGGKFTKETAQNATSFAYEDFKNKTVVKWFKDLAILGIAALPEKEFSKFNALVSNMSEIYSTAKVCKSDGKECNIPLDPDLVEFFKNSKDYDEMSHLWSAFRDATGKKVKKQFSEYVELSNKAAKMENYSDAGESWIDEFESEDFKKDVADLWETLEPLYKQLHAFVRRKLIEQYPDKGIQPDGPIPAHILGNIWAAAWESTKNMVMPYPDKKPLDATDTMKKRNMKPLEMFKTAEEFFVSIGLNKMTDEFWNNSIIEKPKDREIVCHPSAWDFFNGKDFRIKMCTRVDMDSLVTIHHEMGHIEYFQEYSHLPGVFRDGANSGFHEAIGDTIALSVSTPSHLKKIGLIDAHDDSDQDMEINTLMEMALDKIAFLPFGYLVDAYRWKVFSGDIKPDNYNSKWWEMKLNLQGICPPVQRTNEDFDPGNVYHIVADIPYIRYFVSNIIQFQFHKALCDAAGYEGPLHKCDIYQNKKAGKVLSDTLRLGSSVPWTEAMNTITQGKSSKMDAEPLIEYFKPLIDWLKKQNANEKLGWESADPMICPGQKQKEKKLDDNCLD